MTGVLHDIHDLVEAQHRQRVLQSELQHRIRNSLAVTRSILRRAAEKAEAVDDLVGHLDGWLNALTRLQTLLLQNHDDGVALESLLLEEIRGAVVGMGRSPSAGRT